MAEERVQRRLAAILAADVVGYSLLMANDEEETLRTLRAYREVVERLIGERDGRAFGVVGDSMMAEFPSPVQAVRCAVEIQEELARRNSELSEERCMRFRIGINLGDSRDDFAGAPVFPSRTRMRPTTAENVGRSTKGVRTERSSK